MARTKRRLAGLGFLMAVLTVAGCPQAPILVVSPQSLHFDPASTIETFRIANDGGGAINYTVVEDVDWLDIAESAPQSGKGQLTGVVTAEPAFFDVSIIRANLQPGESATAVIQVRTDAGDIDVNVSASIAGAADFTVSPSSFDFGFDGEGGTVTIDNTGSSTLDWTATVETGAGWLTIGRDSSFRATLSDSIASGGADGIFELRVNRTDLSAGNYTAVITFTTNVRNEQITVAMEVPSFVLSPLTVDFGPVTTLTNDGVTVSNRATDPINLTFIPDNTGGGDWLTVQPASLTLQPGATQLVLLQVDPAGLDSGVFMRGVIVADVDTGFTQTISVTMERVGFSLTPDLIDFELISTVEGQSISLTNEGQSPLDWAINIPPSALWLSADASSGTLAAGVTLDVTLFADPAQVEPGSFETIVTVTHENGSEEVTVLMVKARPPALEVSSRSLNFGEASVSQFLGIIHAGDSGEINWSIDTTDFPAWLSITTTDSRVNASNSSLSGTLTATDDSRSHGITVRIRRDLAVPEQGSFSHSIVVIGTGAVTTAIEVVIAMIVAPLPEIQITNTDVDEFGVDFVNIPASETDGSFLIENIGDAQLEWSISVDAFPSWLSSVSPARGTLDPGTSVAIEVTIDREGQDFGTLTENLIISSNDPLREEVPVRVETQVPKVILIGTRNDKLDFGSDSSVDFFEVANVGDPDTILNFRAVPSKEWVSLFPENGQSAGTSGPFKDWKSISVAIDRSQLTDSAASATITIFAFEIVEGVEVPSMDVEPIEVLLSVIAAELTIEVAVPRMRVPSLVRYEMLMRNLRSQVIDFQREAEFGELQTQFNISENGEALPLDETNQRVEDGDELSTNVMILLDYSNSMALAAESVEDPAISGAADPLQALYESTIIPMIQAFPSRFRIGLAVVNERRPPAILCPVSYGNIRPLVETPDAPVFISDKAALIARIQSINVIDHGASELYPAFIDGINALFNEEKERTMFDDTDIRALIAVTDGRVNTSNTNGVVTLADVLGLLVETRVRCYPVGWGLDVLANPLLQMSGVSGGHYYSTKTVRIGEPDAFGRIPRVPVASELRRWCSASSLDGDAQTLLDLFGTLDADGSGQLNFIETLAGLPILTGPDFDTLDLNADGLLGSDEIIEARDVLALCGQSISKDLQSFVTLSYVTLNEEPSVGVEVKLTFNDENDNSSPCLPEDQGDISSSFIHGGLNFEAISGDVRLGQIAVRTGGRNLLDNTATVALSAEYIPRNISRLRIRITPTAEAPNAVAVPALELVTATDGGIIGGWNVTQAGDVYDLTSPDGTPLLYGAAGELFTLTYQNVNFDFDLVFNVEFPFLDSGDRDSKYFCITDFFEVSTDAAFAPGFPQPEVRTEQNVVDLCPFTIDLGSDENSMILSVHNIGGSNSETGAGLFFQISQIGMNIPSDFFILNGEFGGAVPDVSLEFPDVLEDEFLEAVPSSETPYIVEIPVDCTLPAGDYIAKLQFLYTFGTINGGFFGDPFFLAYTVTEPELVLSTNNLDFENPVGTTDLPLIITNAGQSSLSWTIDSGQLPSWLAAGKTSGSVDCDPTLDDGNPNDNVNTINISVDRSGLPAGDYNFDMAVTGSYTDNRGQDFELSGLVTVTMTVPVP